VGTFHLHVFHRNLKEIGLRQLGGTGVLQGVLFGGAFCFSSFFIPKFVNKLQKKESGPVLLMISAAPARNDE